jgi:serine/threonine protein kinase
MPSKEPRDPLDQAFGLLGDEDSWIERLRAAERKDQGLLLGRFEAVEEVGRGGQGIVYKAREGPGGRLVALKRLAAGSFASERARLRFEREVEAATMLAHGNIVSVFGIESAGGQPLLVMEWIDGVDIVSHCRDPKTTRRPLGEIIGLFLDVCAGVIHAHQRGVIHRDLKPKNVLGDEGVRRDSRVRGTGAAPWGKGVDRREG